jgi:hypothetical protein
MKSLFLKIFLSFWAALALSLVLAILVTIALRPARHGIESEGPQILAETVNAYQSGGESGARNYLRSFSIQRATSSLGSKCHAGSRTSGRALRRAVALPGTVVGWKGCFRPRLCGRG